MFICQECGRVYESLPKYTNSHYTNSGEFLGNEEMTGDCPFCNGYLVEAKQCPLCGASYIEDDADMCDNCFDYWATKENAFEMGLNEPTEIEINGFLASVFKETEILELLMREFDKLPTDIQKKYILNYCGEDKYYFKEWLEEKFRNANIH